MDDAEDVFIRWSGSGENSRFVMKSPQAVRSCISVECGLKTESSVSTVPSAQGKHITPNALKNIGTLLS